MLDEEPLKTIYRSTREDIQTRMKVTGTLAHKALVLFSIHGSEAYRLLQRVFDEQYKIEVGIKKVELRPNAEIKPDSVQSPHDPDSPRWRGFIIRALLCKSKNFFRCKTGT